MSYSALILTHNEAINIRRCIESLKECDDVVVVDSHSEDESLEILSGLPVRVYSRQFDSFAGQRNWAIDTIEFKHRWILHLDADECMTPELHAELCDVTQRDEKSAYYIANKIIFMNRWIRRSSMYPFYQARLLRLGESRFEQIGHGQHLSFANRGSGLLKEPYIHYNFSKGISDWLRRHNKYSSDEAQRLCGVRDLGFKTMIFQIFGKHGDERQQALKLLVDRSPCRPLFRFVYLFFWKRAFLDGMPGFHYCMLVTFYDYLIRLKAKEIKLAESLASKAS
jgi:glycosyltransferase involved in cell wall biosynthesis